MRISDWSSDVCSSDLAVAEANFQAHQVVEDRPHAVVMNEVQATLRKRGAALLGPGIAARVRRLRALLVSAVPLRRIGPFGDLLTFFFPVRCVPALVVRELLVLYLREGAPIFALAFELAEH